MSWQCKLFNIVGLDHVTYENPLPGGICGKTFLVDAEGVRVDWDEMPVGAMFFIPENADMHEWPWFLASDERISDYYFQNNSNRRPLFVKLPSSSGSGPVNGELFCIDGKCWNETEMYGGWTVTGEAPNITVSPSIKIGSFGYHGFLQNGVIYGDCEGRTFNP